APSARPQLLFYVPWDSAARAEAPARAAGGARLAPQWVTLTGADGTLAVSDDAAALRLKRGAGVLPLVTNAHDGIWDGAAAGAVFADPALRGKVIARLVELAAQHRWAGYVFDFEALPTEARAAYPAFVAEARTALKARGKGVWVTALLSADPVSQKA